LRKAIKTYVALIRQTELRRITVFWSQSWDS